MTVKRKSKLRVLGRVSARILKSVFPGKELKKQNAEWLFVDYSESDYPAGTVFDVIIEAEGRDWNHDYKIKLTHIANQYSDKLPEISEGYKTICCFEFSPAIPPAVKQLPVLKTWKANDKSIYLCRHRDINLMVPADDTDLMRITVNAILGKMKEKKKQNNNIFKIDDIAQLADIDFRKKPTFVRYLADNLIVTGQVKEENNKLSLV